MKFKPDRSMLALVWGLLLVAPCLGLQATTVLPPEFDTLVNRSDYVVRARVVAAEPHLTTTADRWKIHTLVTLEVLEVIAGEPPEKPVLRFLGGRVGERELVVDGVPQLHVGGESILFIRDNGRALCPLYAMVHGVYPVAEEPATKRRYVIRMDGQPLRDVTEVSRPLTDEATAADPARRRDLTRAFSPEDFIREIKAKRRESLRREPTN